MLPLQKYRNPMNRASYQSWLKKELPKPDEFIKMMEQYQKQELMKNDFTNDASKSSNKKIAEYRASLLLDPNEHLCPIYIDSHIVVVYKKSGVLSVPGPRRNPNVADLVFEYFGNEENDVDQMVVHRLDMDTSGVIVYARSKSVLSILHDVFRAKSQSPDNKQKKNDLDAIEESQNLVSKTYEALICGHMSVMEGEIDLPLVRDRDHPPFMKVWNGESYDNASNHDIATNISQDNVNKHRGYIKMISKAPKESLTKFRVLSKEYLYDDDDDDGKRMSTALPVTRVELTPITGRTHQLRVHCAAIGHPIIGDNIYGIHGDGSPHGGFSYEEMIEYFPNMASIQLQENIYQLVQHLRHQNIAGEDNVQNYQFDELISNDEKYTGNLYLHAKQLVLQHPITNAPMIFEVDPPF